MIKPICLKCKIEFDEFGGVLLSPPLNIPAISELSFPVNKYHLCVKCYWEVFNYINKHDL